MVEKDSQTGYRSFFSSKVKRSESLFEAGRPQVDVDSIVGEEELEQGGVPIEHGEVNRSKSGAFAKNILSCSSSQKLGDELWLLQLYCHLQEAEQSNVRESAI